MYKCHIGLCTPRHTLMDSKKKKKHALQVGPIIKKTDVDTAAGIMQGPIIKSEGSELPRRPWHFKVAGIPIIGDYEHAQWDLIVHGVLNWVGTLPDTFGTNEHLDLLDTVQGLWDKCLPERMEDICDNPVVKKVVSLSYHCQWLQCH